MKDFKHSVKRTVLSTAAAGVLFTGLSGIHMPTDAPAVPTTAQAQSHGSITQFLTTARSLPSVSAIEQMPQKQWTSTQAELSYVRGLYQTLSPAAKQNQEVMRWEEYLTQKEEAAQRASAYDGAAFIQEVKALPSVAAIEQMSYTQLSQLQSQLALIRGNYNRLPSAVRRQADVSRWEGYLSSKEAAVQNNLPAAGTAFVNQVRNLPAVSDIERMNANQLANLRSTMARIRSNYKALSAAEKKQAEVITWESYLSEKEAAAENVSSAQADAFIRAVSQLPNVSAMQNMNRAQLNHLATSLSAARNQYSQLSGRDQQLSEVVRQENFLAIKEATLETLLEEKPNDGSEEVVGEFDLRAFNQEFLKLVNAERNRLGIHSLYYDEGLQIGTDVRAQELLQIGDLEVNGVPHVRPDGSSWVGAFDYYKEASATSYASGENIAMRGYSISQSASFIDYLVTGNQTLEQALAKKFYDSYYNSPGHYQNMISTNHDGFSVSIGFDTYLDAPFKTLTIYNVMVFSAEYPS